MQYRVLPIVCCLLSFSSTAFAHPELGDYVQHRIVLVAGPDRVDLTIEISFDGGRSLHERESIDTDNDGTLSKAERKAYLDRVETDAETLVGMSIDGKPARLIALYGAELDLFDSRGLERHPHLLRLTFFAPTVCTIGNVVTVEDTLWPGAPAILLAEQGEDSAFACVPRQPPAPSAVGARSDVRTVTFDIARGANNTPQPGQSSPRRRSPIASKGRPAHLYRERGAR